jgi:hypothetical protein
MKLIECLTQLPSDLKLVDLTATGTKILTVSEMIKSLPEHHKNEEGYEIKERKVNYGKETLRSIRVIGGPSVYNEASA